MRDKMHEPVRATAKKPDYVRPVAAAQGWNAHVKGVFYRSRSDKIHVLKTDLVIR